MDSWHMFLEDQRRRKMSPEIERDTQLIKEENKIAFINDSCNLNINPDFDDENVLEVSSQTELFLFYSGIENLNDVSLHAPYLTSLMVIGQPLESLKGVENLNNLQELWVVECKLQDASDVKGCMKLEKLYLYSNNLQTIPLLSGLKLLTTLWLGGNQIKEIENLEELPQLSELYIPTNKITEIGTNLITNQRLVKLNISGNPLFRLKDLRQLAKNHLLKSLLLADCLYDECPVSQLCNYRFYLVYHLPAVSEIDNYAVEPEERTKVKDFYASKSLYYSMMVHKVRCAYTQGVQDVDKEYVKTMIKFRDSYVGLKHKETQMKHLAYTPQHVIDDNAEKLSSINVKTKIWDNEKYRKLKALQYVHKVREMQLNYEIQNGGNMKFVEYGEGSKMLEVCQKVMDANTCATLSHKYGVKTIKVIRVTQVINKGLEITSMFSSWLADYSRKDWAAEANILLLVKPYGITNIDSWPFEVFEKGLYDSKESTIEVSECIHYADLQWLKQLKEKPLKMESMKDATRVAVLVQLPRTTALQSRFKNQKGDAQPSSSKILFVKSYSKHCCKYLVSTSERIFPILTVEYQYEFEEYLEHFSTGTKWNYTCPKDKKCPLMAYSSINNNFIKEFLSADIKVQTLTDLSIVGYGMKSIGELPSLPNIKVLNLSVNHFTGIPNLDAFPSIKKLDLSYNLIETMKTGVSSSLEDLNVSWNHLKKFIPNLKYLVKHFGNLHRLNFAHNPINDLKSEDHIWYFTHKLFSKLDVMNNMLLEKFFSNYNTVNLSKKHHWPVGVTKINSGNQWVTCQWIAEFFWEENIGISYDGNFDWSKVTWLYFNNLQFIKISTTEILPSLKWASFANNFIQDISFLVKCPHLEELSLANNVLHAIGTSLHSLKNLVKLNLSGNYISTLKEFSTGLFPNLKLLDVSSNNLLNLVGLETCESLIEFYGSYNQIKYFDDITSIKSCKNMKILDFTGNEIENTKNFRKYIVYNFRKIEYVNGYCIQDSDIHEANQTFGGYLDREYLLKQHKPIELQNLTELTFNHCEIKKVHLSKNLLPSLRSLDLSQNFLTTLSGLEELPLLKNLCLSFNQISKWGDEQVPGECFPKLETLYLNNNRIASLSTIQLGCMRQLKTLFLQNNEITNIQGLQELQNLSHLILDRNRITNILTEEINPLENLKEIYLEGNKIQCLAFLKDLKKLQKVFLGHNKIADIRQFKYLIALDKLTDLTMYGNPLCKTTNYFALVTYALPHLLLLDGHSLDIDNYIITDASRC